MKKYFLIDIDGCITDGKNKDIDLEQFAKLKKTLSDRSINYSLCTGRSATYLEAVAQFLSFNGWSICENGSYLYHSKTDEILLSPLIGSGFSEILGEVKERLSAELASTIKFETGKEMSLSINALKMPVEDLHKHVLSSIPISCIGLVNIDFSTTAVDVTAKGVTKKSGMYDLYELGVIKQTDFLIGVGDSSGDIPFLEECDYTACPQNATTQVKDLVNYVSDYSATRGVIDILKRQTTL